MEKMETVYDPMLSVEKGAVGTETTQTKNQYIATICVSLGAVCAGTALAWTSPVLPQLQEPSSALNETLNSTLQVEDTSANSSSTSAFYLTESQGSLVGSMLAIGALCSALPAGYVADKFGRKKANLFLTLPYMINWLLIVFATSPFMLYVARFFSGIATGAMCVTAPMYIGEIAEVSIRGTLGSFFQMCLCFGILLTYAVGAFMTWVGLSWILMIVPLLFAICLYFMPETPIYLVKTGQTTAAEDSLKFLRGKRYNVEPELKTIQAGLAKSEESQAGVKDLISSIGNRKALISALGLMLFQQLSGINAVIFYTVPIFNSAGTGIPSDLAAIIVSVVQFIIAYVAAMIIDKANRRFYLMLSSSGMCVCLAALGLYFHLKINHITFTGIGMIPLISLVVFIIAFSLGFGPVPWMIMGELFAPEIKGVASGLAVTTNWILVFLVTFSFPIMNSSLGGHITFYLFAIIMVIGTFFVYTYIPETRGKSLQEIQNILNKS
ncbi:hypothetical protein ILUMI_05660 [Ignelater luminosus]|uniref:Major facilitator superfamily (MFS) profile domain-containing protein n=1 Tax=Ignelater luminosus TaxID=2038154 RepID=A0A8K0DC59_IGNLU|nr:hypothetical protein ILUMI_05660 [Ignelater luminosus]